MFAFVYPGPETASYPLMDAVSASFGASILLPLLCGIVSTALVGFFGWRLFRSRFVGLVAAALFALSPAVLGASAHLETSLFNLTLLLLALFLAWCATRRIGSWLGKASVTAVLLLLVVVGVAWARPSDATKDLLFALGIAPDVHRLPRLVLFFFATVPFVVLVLARRRAEDAKAKLSRLLFILGMAIVSILAIATPLSPSAAMEPYGLFPVASCALVALYAGALLAFVWTHRDLLWSRLAFYILAFVLGFSTLFGAFTFDFTRGSFGDRLAEKILADLGDRTWFVTDGSLDRNLRACATAHGKELHLVRLDKDADAKYMKRLAAEFRAAAPAGEMSDVLARSLDIGILAFVEDWLRNDPNVAKKLAIFGAPDLWYASGRPSCPEFAFFGGDPARPYDDRAWPEFSKILKAPKNWGSYELWKVRNPVDRLRLSLRRHIGLCANNRGVQLVEEGKLPEAYRLFSRVFNEIDRDNVSALANLLVLSARKVPEAMKNKPAYDRTLERIVRDKDRRYQLWRLSNFYGYIADPAIFLRLGHDWARSGQPGLASGNLRRAIDFIPSDRRATLMNMLASYYAVEGDREKARALYLERLAKSPEDHDALIGLCGTCLMEGDTDGATKFLERAVRVAGDDPRALVEKALIHYMKGDLAEAEKLFGEAAHNAKDNAAYALLASVLMQRADGEKNAAKKAAIEKDLAERVIPAMEARAEADDFYLLSTRGFVAMRKGPEGLDAARHDLVRAMELKPTATGVHDAVLNVDMALADSGAARRHAQMILRSDRNDPLAHYILGSLAFQEGKADEAEPYLRFAADAKRPVLFAINDLAELYRQRGNLDAAERYARRAVKESPNFATAIDTLASILIDRGGNAAEAAELARKAVERSRDNAKHEPDVRFVLTLARAQVAKGDKKLAAMTLRQVKAREKELSKEDRAVYDQVRKSCD